MLAASQVFVGLSLQTYMLSPVANAAMLQKTITASIGFGLDPASVTIQSVAASPPSEVL